MSEQPSFSTPVGAQGSETTGRYVVTFRDSGATAGVAALKKKTPIRRVMSAADFKESAMDISELEANVVAVFPTLQVAVVTMAEDAANATVAEAGEDSAILAVEPERIFYAIDEGLSISYLRGFRDAVNELYDKAVSGEMAEEFAAAAAFIDDAQSTWGLKAAGVINSNFTGKGIRVAVLDTGLDLNHPDFVGRTIKTKSFITGEPVQDGNRHGTHCIGTSCGNRDNNGRRYGVAHEAVIYVGKVLSNAGSGATTGILSGMEWAITSKCRVISMSLGNLVTTPSPAYENAGRRALQNGCLIVAAAGNNRPNSTVGQPANSASIMAVGAVDNRLRLASFSCGAGSTLGAKVDIAGPGVSRLFLGTDAVALRRVERYEHGHTSCRRYRRAVVTGVQDERLSIVAAASVAHAGAGVAGRRCW